MNAVFSMFFSVLTLFGLQKLPDVERIISRLQRKSASLSEIVQVVNFAELLPTLIELLRSYEGKHAEMLEVSFTVCDM